jgi:hypothetical protein
MPRNIRETIQERIVGPIPIENDETGGKSRTAQKLSDLAQAAMLAGQ